jgi:hypothetical protein|eukprot:COSAG01_NODE_6354_length_3718_cov_7.547665_4_plen_87_part_00
MIEDAVAGAGTIISTNHIHKVVVTMGFWRHDWPYLVMVFTWATSAARHGWGAVLVNIGTPARVFLRETLMQVKAVTEGPACRCAVL